MLTLQRFRSGKKNEDIVKFPLKGLDLSDYLEKQPGTEEAIPLYDLFGVINQVGSLSSGHYTAKCFNEEADCWYNFDDSRINKLETKDDATTSPSSVQDDIEAQLVTSKAYVLFYKQRSLAETLNTKEDYERIK